MARPLPKLGAFDASPAPGHTDPRRIGDEAVSESRLDVAGLYSRHASMVLRRVLRFFPRDEAEEVVHEVFLKVLESADGFRAQASPTTWLYRLTTNHCINRVRDRGRRDELWKRHGAAMWERRVATDEQETAVFLGQFWHSLDDELVQIGVYYFVDGLTHAEIARITGVSRRTIGNRLEELRTRAREKAGLSLSEPEEAGA